MKIRNPIGKMVHMGNGYYRQSISMNGGRGYIKVWYKGEVIDRAMSVAAAKAHMRHHMEKNFNLIGGDDK